MSTAVLATGRKRTADFNKIREHGIYCSKDIQTAIISLPNERKLFISVDKKSREPRLRFYTAARELQW